ncbi:hypothetical protein DRP07_00670 [Archaeoglobales archaeon]|nr:MAG: hypothetical protein DRP07_00670 [Archaeoglobales archaeon]
MLEIAVLLALTIVLVAEHKRIEKFFAKMGEKASSGLAMAAGAVIITLLILGIILGYTGGIGIDLVSGINNTDVQTKTNTFVTSTIDLGFSVLKFNYLVPIAMIAFAVLGFFAYRRRGGGGV